MTRKDLHGFGEWFCGVLHIAWFFLGFLIAFYLLPPDGFPMPCVLTGILVGISLPLLIWDNWRCRREHKGEAVVSLLAFRYVRKNEAKKEAGPDFGPFPRSRQGSGFSTSGFWPSQFCSSHSTIRLPSWAKWRP